MSWGAKGESVLGRVRSEDSASSLPAALFLRALFSPPFPLTSGSSTLCSSRNPSSTASVIMMTGISWAERNGSTKQTGRTAQRVRQRSIGGAEHRHAIPSQRRHRTAQCACCTLARRHPSDSARPHRVALHSHSPPDRIAASRLVGSGLSHLCIGQDVVQRVVSEVIHHDDDAKRESGANAMRLSAVCLSSTSRRISHAAAEAEQKSASAGRRDGRRRACVRGGRARIAQTDSE